MLFHLRKGVGVLKYRIWMTWLCTANIATVLRTAFGSVAFTTVTILPKSYDNLQWCSIENHQDPFLCSKF